MTDIKLSPDNKAELIGKLQDYFDHELDHELGQFDADFLVDFITKEFGNIYYNQGLHDAQAILESRIDSLVEAIAELEK
jgi:uncharacterized protein (DUF2164 family)